MKHLFLSLLLLGLAGAAPAQEAAERQRITAERGKVEAVFAEQEKACYGKFAVNDCIDAARSQRRQALADLRRQEVLLNDMDRKRKADQRLRELQERPAQQARRQPASAPKAQAPPAPKPARQPHPSPRKEPQASRPEPDTGENLRRHQARIEEAQERKAKVEQRAAERKKVARPLPVPP